MRVSRVSIVVNFVLSVLKLLAGLLARSGAMVSDAVHSASDVFSTVIVIIGVKAAGKDADREHPYGHERMESVAAIVLAVVLLFTGLLIGLEGVKRLRTPEDLPVPGVLALIAAIVSILLKEGLYRYTIAAANQIRSDALRADAWHHRSDALSSIGALIGIGGAQLGWPILDPIASLLICLMIGKAALDIFREAVRKMVDERCDEATESAIRSLALGHAGVDGVDALRSRQFGNKVYVDMEIAVNGGLTLTEAHAIAEGVHDEIEAAFPQVKHIMIHVNPSAGGDSGKEK